MSEAGPLTADETTATEEWSNIDGFVRVLRDGRGRFVTWEPAPEEQSYENAVEAYPDHKHLERLPATEWLAENGESVESLEVGDTVKVIDQDHPDAGTVGEVTTIFDGEGTVKDVSIKMVEGGGVGVAIHLLPWQVSKNTDLEAH